MPVLQSTHSITSNLKKKERNDKERNEKKIVNVSLVCIE